VLRSGSPMPTDIGKIKFLDYEGAPKTKYFTNVVSFGMGGEVARRSQNVLRRFSAGAAFWFATLRVFLTYRPKTVELTLDRAQPAKSHRITNIAIGNGRFHGGGMHICPLAHFDDGLLEVTVIDAISFWELLRDGKVLYSANLYAHPKAHHFRAAGIQASAHERVMIEVDGEPLGMLPAEITILPAAIRIWQ
jgi:diacylglycerol kinase (ATP)